MVIYTLRAGLARCAPAFEPIGKVVEIYLQSLAVLPACLAIHAGCGLPLQNQVQHQFHTADPTHLIRQFYKVLQVFESTVILAGLLFITFGCLMRCCSAFLETTRDGVPALGTGPRNIAAALVIGNQSFDQEVTMMVIVVAIIGLVTLMPLAGGSRRGPAQ
jgi:hypothetical protein